MNLPELSELTFEPNGHIYKLRGFEIPSMTTLMKPLTEKVYGGISDDVLARAAERGTSVHESCENYALFRFDDCDPEYTGYFRGFKAWWDAKRPEVIATEQQVYHKVLGYAGMTDLICLLDGRITLIDYKTTSRLEHKLCAVQLEGYDRAWESHGIIIEDRVILHLQNTGRCTEHHYPRSAECWRVVSALMTIFKYGNKK